MQLYKAKPGKPIENVIAGTWESNLPCPPAATKPCQKILSQIFKEQTALYWRLKHKVKPEYLTARGKHKVHGVDSASLVSETAMLRCM